MKNAKYTSLLVANSILVRFFKEGIDISPMKLQKLIYIVYKEYLTREHVPLFSEEFETWQYGPVVRTVYDEFKSFGSRSITKYATDAIGKVYVCNEEADDTLRSVLDRVFKKYRFSSAIDLSKKTHNNKDSAWRKAAVNNKPILHENDIQSEYSYL